MNPPKTSTQWQTHIAALPPELIEFYLLKCPYAKSDQANASSAYSLNLADNGWEGPKLNRLMQWLSLQFIDKNGKLSLQYSLSDDIRILLEVKELLNTSRMPSTSQAYLAINRKISITAQNECTVELKETYATCFFRHIRNCIAHGGFYSQDDHLIFFDSSSKPNTKKNSKKYTFGMSTTLKFLMDLKRVVEGGEAALSISEEDKARLKGMSYKVDINKEIKLEQQDEDQ